MLIWFSMMNSYYLICLWMLLIVNPFTLETIKEISFTSLDDIELFINSALAIHKNKTKWIPKHKIVDIFNTTIQKMISVRDLLANMIVQEGGKPITDARIEVDRAINTMHQCIVELSKLSGKQVPMDLTSATKKKISFSKYEPIGVVLAISAFNHPLNLIVHQVAPSIASGCPVIVKPSIKTPLCAQKFVDILYESGLPKEWCKVVICDDYNAQKMAMDNRISFMSFIGSADVGWMLKSKTAPGVRCALEHGGLAPVIIDETANIDNLLPCLMKGAFYHSGQACISTQRIFIPKKSSSDTIENIVHSTKNLKTGDPTMEDTFCGPLINSKALSRVEEWVRQDSHKSKIILGGKRLSCSTYAPTILLNPDNQSYLSNKEIFGPVVGIYEYDNIESALSQANESPSIQASIFTNRYDIAMKAIQDLDSSTVLINEGTAFRVDWMPFSGRKICGYGVSGVEYTMRSTSQEKLVIMNYS